MKIDVRPISGRIFLFCLVKTQNNVKFCEVYNLSRTIGKTTRKRMIHFQILQSLPMKGNFICKFSFFGKFGKFCFLFKGVFNCVAYFMDLKCENFTFSFLQENINLISLSL